MSVRKLREQKISRVGGAGGGNGEPAAPASGGPTNLLGEVVLAADAPFIEIPNISGAFKDLRIVAALRSDRAADFDDAFIQVGNGAIDTGSNYRWFRVFDGSSDGQSSSESDTKWNLEGSLPGNTADAGNFGMIQLAITGYADPGVETFMQWDSDHYRATSFFTMNGWGRWDDAAVIDVIRFTPGTGSWRAGSSIRIYGEPVIGEIIAGYSPILDHKATVDTPDDEFNAATLDAKWTAVSGVAGTVDQFAIIATNTPIYDLSTRPGWLLTQVRQNDGITTGSVRLRQDFTLADGDSIVIAHTLPTYIGHPSAATNNESVIEIVLNDNDSGETAGNRVVVRYIVASLEQVQVYGGLVTNLLHNIYEGSRIFYTRILRKDDGATEEYYIGLSEDGTNWNWKGASAGTGFAPGVELNNLWITHSSVAGVGAEESPIIGFFFVRQGTNNLDPWGHTGLIQLDSVPEWMTALAGRVGGETAHVDDDFFGQDSSADYTEQTVSGTGIWTIGRGVLSSVFKNQSGGASPDWSGFLKPITSPSPPMTIETHLRLFVPTLDFPSVGLGFTDGVAVGSNVAAMASVGSDFDFQAGGIAKYGGTMNDFNNSVDTVISPSQMGFNGQVMEIYMRFVWISANIWQQVISFDGNAWYNWGSADMSFTMTPTHFGLLVSTRGQNLNFSVGYDYFRVYDVDLSV